MITKGCLYHIVRVKDLDSEIPPIPGIPPEWEIDFGIDLLPNTNSISIPK